MNDFKEPGIESVSKSVKSSNLNQILSDPEPPIPYEVPSWAEEPTSDFFFEIIKNGSIIGKSQPISSSKVVAGNISFCYNIKCGCGLQFSSILLQHLKEQLLIHLQIGRLPVCDIEIEHPSASRYHAVVQFKENCPFIYDLSSSHGTFLNKSLIEPRKYIRLHVGDMLTFGASSRIYVLQGPQEDAEKREEALLQKDSFIKKEAENLEVSWGFKEDAYEGDEWGGIDVSGSVDRTAISDQNFYFEDPKKALAFFIENNGAESQISYTHSVSNGPREYVAKLEITGLRGPLTAVGKGKKKGNAEKDACLEACYKLEKLGILYLNEGSQADRTKRLRDEYLKEERDNYLDKTSFDNANEEQKKESIETLKTLTLSRNEKLQQIQDLKKKIESFHGKVNSNPNEEEDELEVYMNKINEKVKKEELKKVENIILIAEKEILKFDTLIELARPKGKLSSFTQPSTTANALKIIPQTLNEVNSSGIGINAKSDSKEEVSSISPVSKKIKISDSKVKVVKGPSKEEQHRHQIEQTQDIVDCIPSDILNQKNFESLSKKAAEKYGY